jgi:hypothetical protein
MSRMTGVEVLTEAEYLLAFGEHPAMVAKALGRSAQGIYRMAYRAGNETVYSAFSPEVSYVRSQREGVHA